MGCWPWRAMTGAGIWDRLGMTGNVHSSVLCWQAAPSLQGFLPSCEDWIPLEEPGTPPPPGSPSACQPAHRSPPHDSPSHVANERPVQTSLAQRLALFCSRSLMMSLSLVQFWQLMYLSMRLWVVGLRAACLSSPSLPASVCSFLALAGSRDTGGNPAGT